MNPKLQPLLYRRRPTRTVQVGDLGVGGQCPIRVQSMTTPATTDTPATVAQIVRLVEAGCEIVRVTVPTSADADNLPAIRRELAARGIRVPLVADIHFTPAAALRAVEHVEKVRINPGNFADKKRFAVREYNDAEYAWELERIEKVFSPLVKRCKELGVAMRIGTNHGSLSDRVLNRFGDTPEGMVESALEFVRICEAHGYRDLILSMKASNTVVVLQAYRLLAARMAAEGMDYPFHLGVTEAGDGEDGRIKSAIGIGALLDEGIGDTVRVSLTEDPVAEIPVALALVEPYNRVRRGDEPLPAGLLHALRTPVREARDPFHHARRASTARSIGPHVVGGDHVVRVEVPLVTPAGDEVGLRRELDGQAGVRVPEDTRADLVTVDATGSTPEVVLRLRRAMELVAPRVSLAARIDAPAFASCSDAEIDAWIDATHRLDFRISAEPFESARRTTARWIDRAKSADRALLLEVVAPDLPGGQPADVERAVDLAVAAAGHDAARAGRSLLLAIAPRPGVAPLHAYRLLAARLAAERLDPPIVLVDDPSGRGADPLLGPSIALGALLCDGIGDAVRIEGALAHDARCLAFGVLQASRVRITRTEFISCPSCGRTLFDLEETTERIRTRTAHLKGVKIAIMGCVVNGPGEMADADFGYVGWGEEKIALFVGKQMVAKDIPTDVADERLVELIKARGRWVEPPVPVIEGV